MVELTITIQGDKSLLEKLKRIRSSLEDMSSPFMKVGELLTRFYSTVPFDSRGSVYGTAWPSLSPEYAKRKAERWGGGRPILVASGKLSKSFKYKSGKDMLQIYNETGDLFAWHQLGMGNNPERVMMLLDSQRRDIVLKEVKGYVQGKVDNA